MSTERITTSQSFAEAVANSLPLSSHGPTHAPSLERGKACLTCRQRKVKCDGVKPTCGACERARRVHGDAPGTIICNFDEPEERTGKRKRTSEAGNKGGKVAALEAKIAELERALQAATTSNDKTPMHHHLSAAASYDDPVYTRNNIDILLQASAGQSTSSSAQLQPNLFASTSSSTLSFPDANLFLPPAASSFFNNPVPTSSPFLPTPPNAPLSPPDHLLDLFYPGWPRDLPSPTLVTRLIDVYFAKSHAATGMLNKTKFLASMTLSPTHPQFPSSCLLHAILASSARMVSEDFFAQEEKYWGKDDHEETVADYHAVKAKLAIDVAVARGQKLFQVAQAIVLLCFYSYSSARFVEVWLYCGLATRIAVPLGLNHIRRVPKDGIGARNPCSTTKANLLQPTDDEDELYERSVTFWLAVCCDRFASASTGWSMSLDDDDITSLLPSPGHPLPVEDLIDSPLSPQNPNFLVAHPPHLVQSLQLYVKAVVLLGRVVSFLQRAPAPIGMSVTATKSEDQADLRTTSAFKKLDADTVTFRLSVPREFQTIQQHANPDNRMCLIFSVPHASTILLHEPFCTMTPGCASLARCLLSAKAILESIYTLWSSSFEIGLLAPFVNFTWAVAGRTLVRDLAIRQAKNNLMGQDQLKGDVNTILAALRAYKSPLGDSTAKALQHLLDNPSQCLPQHDLKHLGLGFGPGGSSAFCQNISECSPASSSASVAEPQVSFGVDFSMLGTDGDQFKEMLLANLPAMDMMGWGSA